MIAGATVLVAAFALGPLGNVGLAAGIQAGSSLRLIDQDAPANNSFQGRERRLGELGIAPHLALESDGRLRLSLAYAPNFRVPFEQAPSGAAGDRLLSPVDRATVLHEAELRFQEALGLWTLRGGASATYGDLDLLAGSMAVDQPVTTTSRIPYRAFALTAGFTARPWRLVSLSVDVRAASSGGDGSEAEQALPVQREVHLDGSLEYHASRRDTWGAVLSLLGSRIERRSDAVWLQAGASWARALSRRFTSRLSGGAAAAYESAPERGTPVVLPWAEGSLTYESGEGRPTCVITAGAQPAVDRLTGTVDYRGLMEVRVGWSPSRPWRLEVAGQASLLDQWLERDVRNLSPTWIGGTSARVARSIGTSITLGGGVSSTWQDSGRPELATFREIAVTLDVSAALPR